MVTTADGDLPIEGARVRILSNSGALLYETVSDSSGATTTYSLTAPDAEYTTDVNYSDRPEYSTCTVEVSKQGFQPLTVKGVEIVDTQLAILPVNLAPLMEDNATPHGRGVIDIPPISAIGANQFNQQGFNAPGLRDVFIPEFIRVHLGVPTNTSARTVRVRFIDYIKNVTSSEIYPTWPVPSLIANIHCIVTFALNRIYTEWYPSRGHNFDITNSTRFDQFFVYGRNIFQNISDLVDQYFSTYAHRQNFRNPFFTQYCNGTTATCNGLSQWGTVDLARRGFTPLQMLRHYYPSDIVLEESANVEGIANSYPGTAMRLGSRSVSVQRMQNMLNRIRVNFPAIPQITQPFGTFDAETDAAVRAFQRIMNLTSDGVIGPNTWNSITRTYVAVTRLAELDSEGHRIGITRTPPNVVLQQGARGANVNLLQFLLQEISMFHPEVPFVIKDSNFGPATRTAVIEFQRAFGLNPDGIVGPNTWARLYQVYWGIRDNVTIAPNPPPPPPSGGGQNPGFGDGFVPYPGTLLRNGSRGESVRLMQQYLNSIRVEFPFWEHLNEDGVFGPRTEAAVRAFQNQFGLNSDGIIGPMTWAKIVEEYMLVNANTPSTGSGANPTPPPIPPSPPTPPSPQPVPPGGRPITPFWPPGPPYPGVLLREGMQGPSILQMQRMLNDLWTLFPNQLVQIPESGIFGPITTQAVRAFQQMHNLSTDGIVGPITWQALVNEHLRNFRI